MPGQAEPVSPTRSSSRWHPVAQLLAGASLLIAAAGTYAGDAGAPPPESADSSTPGVLIEDTEPRFVAPTRRDRIGRVWAPVLIDGKGPFRLVLDTGSNSSAVTTPVVEALGLKVDASRVVTLHGVTGSAKMPTIPVDRLEFGELVMRPRRIPVVADVFGGAEGVLGANGLDDKRIYIDFRNDAIRISRSRGSHIEAGFTRIPVNVGRGPLLTAEANVGGIRTLAVIDTGAQLSIGNLALREALLRRPRQQEARLIEGVTLDIAQGNSIPSPPIDIGALRVLGLHITFSDVSIFEHWRLVREPALLVGMDVLGTLDALVIDYRMRELQVRERFH